MPHNKSAKKENVSMVPNVSPANYNPSQEMSRKTLELRYCLDTESPHVEFHAHPFYEIYYFLEGPMESYVVGGRSYRLRPGDILMMPPGIPHHPIFTEESRPYRRYVLWLSEDQLEQMEHLDSSLLEVLRLCQEQEAYRIRCSTPSASHALESYLSAMWQEEQNASSCKYAYLYGLCLNFLVLLNRIIADEHALVPKYRHTKGLLDKVLAYIHANYAKGITLNSVAEHFFTSPSNIESLLTKKVGKPFYRYVTECRIIHAQALIASGMPLKEVGAACGYNDYSNFYRAFVREVGISPSQYRQHFPTDHFQSTPITETT